MNDLVKFAGGLPVNPEDLEAGLKNVAQSIQGSTGGVPFLRLLKSGIYAYGAEKIEPQEGSQWAINPYSLHHGFACWGDGELLDERMVPFTQQPPNRNELPDYGHAWDQQVAMQLQCLNGEDTGTNVLYKGTSTGLRNAVKELINQLIVQLQKDASHCVPVVELDCDSYEHKKYGEIFFPVLTVQRWLSVEGQETPAGAIESDESEAKPDAATAAPVAEEAAEEKPAPRRRRRASAAEPEAEADPEKPTSSNRRRRRRAAAS